MPNRYDEDGDRVGRSPGGYHNDRDENRGWRGERRPDYHWREREQFRDDLSRFGRFDDEMEYEGGYRQPRGGADKAGYGGRPATDGWREQGGGYGRGESGCAGMGGEAFGGSGRGGTYGDRYEPYVRGYGQYGYSAQSQDQESQGYGHDTYGYGRQGGYQRPQAFGQSHLRHAHDLNYRDWCDRQNHQFNEDFVAFSAEKQKQFDTEFDQWRRNRSQTTGAPQGQIGGRQSGLTDSQMTRGAEAAGKPDETSSKKT